MAANQRGSEISHRLACSIALLAVVLQQPQWLRCLTHRRHKRPHPPDVGPPPPGGGTPPAGWGGPPPGWGSPPPGWGSPPPGWGSPPPGWGPPPAPWGMPQPGWNPGFMPTQVGSGRFRSMSVGEWLDATFSMYRRNFALIASISAVVQIPYALLTWLLFEVTGISGFVRSPFSSLNTRTITPAQAQALLNSYVGVLAVTAGLLVLSLLVVLPLGEAATTRAVSDRYLDRPSSLGSAYRAALSRLRSTHRNDPDPHWRVCRRLCGTVRARARARRSGRRSRRRVDSAPGDPCARWGGDCRLRAHGGRCAGDRP